MVEYPVTSILTGKVQQKCVKVLLPIKSIGGCLNKAFIFSLNHLDFDDGRNGFTTEEI